MLLNCGVREDPWESIQIKPVHPKRNQSWTFIGRTVAEAEAPIVWPPYVKSWLLRKDPEAGQDWRQEETGMTEDEMVGWHHWLDGYEFEKALGVGEGQGSLACCSPWGRKESDLRVTELTESQAHAEHLVQWLTYPFIYCGLRGCNPNCRRGVSWSVKFHLKQGTKIPLYGMLTLPNCQDQLNKIIYQLLHSTLYGDDTTGMC